MASPQKENGYTSIANEILEKIISSGLNGTEMAVLMFILRKTYGFHKLEDEISLSQFARAIPVTKKSICVALNKLQLVNIITLVNRGSSKYSSNLWNFNKNYDLWTLVKNSTLVKKSTLVKFSSTTSVDIVNPLVKKTTHTKESIQKKKTKERKFLGTGSGGDHPKLVKERLIIPPTIDMVTAYCQERGKGIDPQKFMDSYASKGWVVGKTKMVDWQAAVRTWENQDWNKKVVLDPIDQEIREIAKLHPDCAWDKFRAKHPELTSDEMLVYIKKFDY